MQIERYNQVFNSLDAIGLGAFTVVGVDTAISYNVDSYFFLTLFVGVITGVGGGLIRDSFYIKGAYLCLRLPRRSSPLCRDMADIRSRYRHDNKCIDRNRNPHASQTLRLESSSQQTILIANWGRGIFKNAPSQIENDLSPFAHPFKLR